MAAILLVILGQCVFVLIVFFILKNLLDKELMRAALEKLESCKSSTDVQEITVLSAAEVRDEFKSQLESIRKRKFAQTTLNFRENAELKGGIVIAVGDLLLDFSLSSRLQNFWS